MSMRSGLVSFLLGSLLCSACVLVRAPAARAQNVEVSNGLGGQSLDPKAANAAGSLVVVFSNVPVPPNVFACVTGVKNSTDGGLTWKGSNVLQCPLGGLGDMNLPTPTVLYDPVAVKTYLITTDISNGVFTLQVHTSLDAGQNFGTAVQIAAAPTGSAIAAPFMAVDQSSGATRGTVYVGYIQFTAGGASNALNVVVSTNQGDTWSSPTTAMTNVQSPRFIRGGDGTIRFLAIDNSGNVVGAQTTNQGANFQPFTPAVAGGPFIDARYLSIADTAPDASGKTVTVGGVAVCITGCTTQTYTADVDITTSLDGGLTFTIPVKVNIDPTGLPGVFPTVALSQDGTAGSAAWYTTADPTNLTRNFVYRPFTVDLTSGAINNLGPVSNVSDVPSPVVSTPPAPGMRNTDSSLDGAFVDYYWTDSRNGPAGIFFDKRPVAAVCPTITISPKTLDAGTVGKSYSQALSADPPGAYAFNVIGGINGTGGLFNLFGSSVLTSGGIPLTQADTFTITVTATPNPNPNNCPPGSITYTWVVNQETPPVTLTSDTYTPVFGQTVNLTGTAVTTGGGSDIDTGLMTFYDGTSVLGTRIPSNNIAQFSISTLAIAPHPITVGAAADNNHTMATSPSVIVTVSQAPTTTTLTASQNPGAAKQPVTYTGTVTVTPPGRGTPTGTITFMVGLTVLGTVPLGASGSASLTTTFSIPGS